MSNDSLGVLRSPVDNVSAADPLAFCAAIGVSLRVSTRSLRAKGRAIFGAWDPLLRRIELFGVGPDLADEQLVRTFAHELYHVRRHARSAFGGNGHATLRFLRFCVSAFLRFRAVDEEAAADEFADARLHTLGPECIARWAAALRRLACDSVVRESAVSP